MSTVDNLRVPDELTSFIRAHGSFVIAGHKEPDGDCLGSQLALASALERIGKTVQLVNPGPFERQEILPYEKSFSASVDFNCSAAPEAVVVLDCSSPDRLGAVADQITSLPTAIVDHHAAGDVFGDILYIRPEIPATTMLVTAILEALGITPTPEEARLLFLGLVTDTGFFRFLGPHQSSAFDTASRLVRAGASPRETDRAISTGRSLESRLLLARLLQRAEQLRGGEILLTHQTKADEKEFGNKRDSDALYWLLLSVEGVRIVALVKEKDGGCAVSFRATDETDLGSFATRFGGGGHQKAAGAYVEEPLHRFLPPLRAALTEL